MPSSSGCRSPASLPLGREGPICSQLALLWYSLNPLFCEHSRGHRVMIEPFEEKVVCVCVCLANPWFGLLSHISFLRLSSGHSGLVLTIRIDDAACTSLPSPHSLVVDRSVWATSLLAVAVRHIFCEVFFPSCLCCPLRFQNPPQTHL